MLRIAGISPPFHFTVRFTQDHGRLTGWHYLHWRVSENGRIKERMTKNVERKEIKEVREAAHNTPSLNVTKRSERPCDQKIRKS